MRLGYFSANAASGIRPDVNRPGRRVGPGLGCAVPCAAVRSGVGRGVLGVGEVVTPFGVAFGEGEVDHEPVAGRAVPVPFVGSGDDDVAGAESDERPPRAWTKPSPSVQ